MKADVGSAIWERVVREQERADNSSGFAARHERIMASGPARDAAFHKRMAAAHRLSERRHMAMADLYCTNALRTAPDSLAQVIAVAGARAAILSTVDTRAFRPLVLASGRRAERVLDMEFVLGEGPIRDVLSGRGTVVADGEDLDARWPAFGPELRALGYHALAAVPLRLYDVLVGALVLLDTERPLEGGRRLAVEHLGNALVRVLSTNGSGSAPVATDGRTDIIQAAEVIALYHGGTLDDAIAIIRSRALAEHQRVDAVLRTMLQEYASKTG